MCCFIFKEYPANFKTSADQDNYFLLKNTLLSSIVSTTLFSNTFPDVSFKGFKAPNTWLADLLKGNVPFIFSSKL
jgi:hypothetical protein